ncbi:MAG TPA: FAD-dependent oxidoreductase [Candidatus Limnocylindrales bacterium]|nr:FAD-dependent oxidoreductase [Candidatus Limnocylindrales bacterium]
MTSADRPDQLDLFLSQIDRTVDEKLTNRRIEEHLRYIKNADGTRPTAQPEAGGTICSDSETLVIGAGISGLTTALTLLETGYRVRVLADHLPMQTTSAAAGASWGPYMTDDPRTYGWAQATLAELEATAQDPTTGVTMTSGIIASRTQMPVPPWAKEYPGFRICQKDELPAGYVFGWWGQFPVVDMPTYLAHLTQRLHTAGVDVEQVTVDSLDQLRAPTIVNCAGSGAGRLAGDPSLVPVQGQLVVLENPGVHWYFEDISEGDDDTGELIYFIPHGEHIVLGGSATKPSQDLVPDPEISARIIERAVAIEPKLAHARVLGHRVGIRPARPRVRVERTIHNGQQIVHNYGHGGAGVTLSWGCAKEVLKIMKAPP